MTRVILAYSLFAVCAAHAADLWVEAGAAHAAPDGSSNQPYGTIAAGIAVAQPGDTVQVRASLYREQITAPRSGRAGAPIRIVAADGAGTAELRGTEPLTSGWRQCTSGEIALPPGIHYSNVYVCALPNWQYSDWLGTHDYPSDLLLLFGGGTTTRLHRAREPDWDVTTWYKWHEHWYKANMSVVRTDYLIDNADEAYHEPGGPRAFNDVEGATIFALDQVSGHYHFRRTVTAHNHSTGRLDVDEPCEHDNGQGAFGDYTRYYLENDSEFMDHAGEWVKTGTGAGQRIYVLTGSELPPAQLAALELGKRFNAVDVSGRSHITLDGLALVGIDRAAWHPEYDAEDGAVLLINGAAQASTNIVITNCTVRQCISGVHAAQDVSGGRASMGLYVQCCRFEQCDHYAIDLATWNGAGARPAGFNTVYIEHSSFDTVGLRPVGDMAVAISIAGVDRVALRGCVVRKTGHNAVQFFDPHPGHVLADGNYFERCMLYSTDGGAIKFHGGPYAYQHAYTGIFINALVCNNTIRDVRGWSYAQEQRDIGYGTRASWIGCESYGVYMDLCGGVACYRNVLINGGSLGIGYENNYRAGANYVYHNTIHGSRHGVHLGPHISAVPQPGYWRDTRVAGNIFSACEAGNVCLHHTVSNLFNPATLALSRAPYLGLDYNVHHYAYPCPFETNAWFAPGDYQPGALAALDEDWNTYRYDGVTGTGYAVRALTPFEDHGGDSSNALPLFAAGAPSLPEDFMLHPASAARDVCPAPVPILAIISNLNSVLNVTIDAGQPPDGLWDAGAYEYVPEPGFVPAAAVVFLCAWRRWGSTRYA